MATSEGGGSLGPALKHLPNKLYSDVKITLATSLRERKLYFSFFRVRLVCNSPCNRPGFP